jgi:hypothetical protein
MTPIAPVHTNRVAWGPDSPLVNGFKLAYAHGIKSAPIQLTSLIPHGSSSAFGRYPGSVF